MLLSTTCFILLTCTCLSSKYFETVSSLLKTTLKMYRKVRCHVFAIISIKWKLLQFENLILIGQKDGPMGSFREKNLKTSLRAERYETIL